MKCVLSAYSEYTNKDQIMAEITLVLIIWMDAYLKNCEQEYH